MVRFLPLIFSLLFLNKLKYSSIIEFSFLIFMGIVVYLSSERTALFLLFIFYIFYFLISNKKILFFNFNSFNFYFCI